MIKTLEYTGSLMAITGALLVALNIDQTIGYILFTCSSVILILHSIKINMLGLLTMQTVFCIINILGIITRV